jgi:hypothetical protein
MTWIAIYISAVIILQALVLFQIVVGDVNETSCNVWLRYSSGMIQPLRKNLRIHEYQPTTTRIIRENRPVSQASQAPQAPIANITITSSIEPLLNMEMNNINTTLNTVHTYVRREP